ncbi:cobalamin B12-binding domain-containing protein [Aminipila luticellarii]|uniref:Methylmalonyl-CoA mutase n=1 Tax=Aminipila luticellarii TaxID=2507160 RepID=A0A410PWK9_9FIRM|nr:cobalamin-dependent protein [Aminipila luticellarii]QAT43280.1 methylmalonyl-CoA mutase [Aminipila luticellarii]
MDLKFKWKFNIKDLPDMGTLNQDVYNIAKDVTIGKTLFMEEHGVSSEKEYKEKMMKEKKIMKHSAIGWNSWQKQEEGIRRIYAELNESGSYIDRYGACMDWVMGVPEEYKSKLQAGSGLILKNEEEWARLGQVEPIQPHLGDHMIGSLNSLNNTILGLKAGVTTIGNISHYYTYEYPGLDMEEYRTIDMVKAIGLMAKLRDKGTIIHSNLDDGFGAQFHDLANLVGYAKLERYICEELLGARMSHCFGNLFNDPMVRIVFNSAMGKINTYHTPGTMIYGNTIDFTYNMPKNYAAVTSYAMADAIGQMICPSGHAITPIPVTEAIRIPAVDEIIDAHHTVDMAIEAAAYYKDYIDVQKIEAEADILVACGNIFFERVLNGLDDQNIDITHPGEVLAALKAIGVTQLETCFGVGKKDSEAMRGRVPVRPTSIVQEIAKQQAKIMSGISGLNKKPLSGVNVIVASTDVHEFGKEISKNVLVKAGAEVFDLGATVAVEELADTIIETESKAVLISTYNGIAYSFASEMSRKFKELNINVPVVMGGRLNEPMDGSDLPVDVADKLEAMGINVDNDIDKIISYLVGVLKLS